MDLLSWGVHEQDSESLTSLRENKSWICLCGLIKYPIKNNSQSVRAWQRSAQPEYRALCLTDFMAFTHTHTHTHTYSIYTLHRCLCCVQSWNVSLPCETAQYAALWTFQSRLQLTARPAASHVNLIKSFSLRLWRLICLFSAVSSHWAAPLSAHTHNCTHTLVERRHFVTWGRRYNYLGNQCDRMIEGQDNGCQTNANCPSRGTWRRQLASPRLSN